MKKINIITPVYNEAEVIGHFHQALIEFTAKHREKYQFEVIYVVDKGTDNSFQVIQGFPSGPFPFKAVQLSKRFGHQMSLVAGMDLCNGDAVVMMDSDLEHPPEIISELLVQFEKGFDVVYTKREYHEKVSFLKKISSGLFYKMLNSLSDIEINADAADFRLISAKVLKVFQNQIREQNQFLRGLFPWVGFSSTSVSFQSEVRKLGRSKYTIKRLMRLATIGLISFSKKPLQFSIYTGLVLSGFSFCFGIFSIIQYLMQKQMPQGYTTLITLISLIGGIQLIVLGIIGEYIGSIYEEVKKRPLYIIEAITEK